MTSEAERTARILVVDDDKAVANSLVDCLTRVGYSAKAVYSGREGLSAFKEDKFHMVIVDLKMPDMDGIEVMQAIKAVDKNVVVLVITGFSTIDGAVDAMKQGAYDFISKPLELKSLELIIGRALERHRLFKRLGTSRAWILALIVSLPLWMILGAYIAHLIIR